MIEFMDTQKSGNKFMGEGKGKVGDPIPQDAGFVLGLGSCHRSSSPLNNKLLNYRNSF
jgi:hypothetical protein